MMSSIRMLVHLGSVLGLGACSGPTTLPTATEGIGAISTQVHLTAQIAAVFTQAHETAFASLARLTEPAPSPTATAQPSPIPSHTPTPVVLPIVWNGTYHETNAAPIGVSFVILKLDGDLFSGNMIYRTGNWDATLKMEGQFANDFGDATQQAKWANHPDYKAGDTSGTWLNWTETENVKGWGITLGGWYYGHIREDGTLFAIFYYGDEVSSFASGDRLELSVRAAGGASPISTLSLPLPRGTAAPATATGTLPSSGNLALNRQTSSSRSESWRPASRAVDGDTASDWGSGAFPPQWIQIDLGAEARVSEIRLLATQYPDGYTEHSILVGAAPGDLVEVHRFQQETRSGQWLIFSPEAPLAGVRFVRVLTTRSPSWVGWVEIRVLGER